MEVAVCCRVAKLPVFFVLFFMGVFYVCHQSVCNSNKIIFAAGFHHKSKFPFSKGMAKYFLPGARLEHPFVMPAEKAQSKISVMLYNNINIAQNLMKAHKNFISLNQQYDELMQNELKGSDLDAAKVSNIFLNVFWPMFGRMMSGIEDPEEWRSYQSYNSIFKNIFFVPTNIIEEVYYCYIPTMENGLESIKQFNLRYLAVAVAFGKTVVDYLKKNEELRRLLGLVEAKKTNWKNTANCVAGKAICGYFLRLYVPNLYNLLSEEYKKAVKKLLVEDTCSVDNFVMLVLHEGDEQMPISAVNEANEGRETS